MLAQVIFKATQGSSSGEEFIFTGKTHCVVGRASGCSLCLPGDDLTASRYHCLLDIDAPLVWVEDLGSFNGTFVNGECLGRRDRVYPGDGGKPQKAPPRLLVDGDELRVVGTAFAVVIDETPHAMIDSVSMAEECMASA
jgi:pSer/pThr/pTyr-binding forkhead associated (FHA) protein